MSSNQTIPQISSGAIFYSNNEAFLEGVQRGIDFVNDSALSTLGIFESTSDQHKLMLIVEDDDSDEEVRREYF